MFQTWMLLQACAVVPKHARKQEKYRSPAPQHPRTVLVQSEKEGRIEPNPKI